jgi:hypothetical protein
MLAIRTYGHFWSRDLIDWGWQNKKGTLLAARKPGAAKPTADFREQIGIYALFDEHRDIVYVGQTGSGKKRLWSRLRDHNRGQLRDRWNNFSWFGFLDVSRDGLKLNETPYLVETSDFASLTEEVTGSFADALNEIEAVVIQLVEPRLNKRGPNWKNAVEFFQYDPDGPEPTNRELLEKLEMISGPSDNK